VPFVAPKRGEREQAQPRLQQAQAAESFGTLGKNLPLFELARVLMRFDHIACKS
jgi:hypothetical protein